jgi:rhodanese-related sulfurtransferase
LLQSGKFYNRRLFKPDPRLAAVLSFLIENWIPAVMALASGALLLWPVLQRGAQGGAISTNEAVRLINREKAVVIDVCEPAEFAAAHVAGARSVPLGALQGAKGLPSNKALPLVVVCASGARATRAVGQLRKLGYANAQALAGGLKAWRDANLPIEASKAG